MSKEMDMAPETVASDKSQETTLPEDAQTLQQLLAEEKANAQRFLDSWKRAQADFVNYRRRTDEERSEQAKLANSALVLSLLPVLDDLERALGSASPDTDGGALVEGLQLIHRKLMNVLEGQGLSAIESLGQTFDPNLHEAVSYAEGEDGEVVQEWQRGYKLHDRVIRPAMVCVGKKGVEAGSTTEQT
jgi:molecular chaperone GrpE